LRNWPLLSNNSINTKSVLSHEVPEQVFLAEQFLRTEASLLKCHVSRKYMKLT
jgi:hypothetical protein